MALPSSTITVAVNLSGLDQDASASVSAVTRQTVVGTAVIQGPVGSTGATGAQGPTGSTGATGPANTLSIGSVTNGGSAGASITGTAPAQTLNLVLPAGPTGATGTAGTNGTNGAAATIAVGTTTTGTPGSSASVTNSGSSSAATFNFTIPAGATGATGTAGSTGATGPASAWGTIPGTLSSQTDLQTELDARVLKAGDTMTGVLNMSSSAPAIYLTPSSGNQTEIRGGGGNISTVNRTAGTFMSTQTATGLAIYSSGSFISATHTLTLPSTGGTGIALYNTVDQVTNREYMQMSWISNTFKIQPLQSGTGSLRTVQFGTDSANMLTGAGSAPRLGFNVSSTNLPSSAMFGFTASGLTAASGAQIGMGITVTSNQTGTAGYTSFLLNTIETLIGSGTKLMVDFQLGGVSRFSVNTSGSVTTGGFVQAGQINPTSSAAPGNGMYLPSANTIGWSTNSALRLSLSTTGLTFSDGINISVQTTNGTKIGTATTQKLGFWNATPIVQPTGDIATALSNLGLVASPTIRTVARTTSIASSSTPTPDVDSTDHYTVTALAAGATFGAPTGTPVDGDELTIRIKDNGTARSLAFNAIYRFSSDLTAPTTTVISKTLYMKFKYNSADTKWDCLAWLNNF